MELFAIDLGNRQVKMKSSRKTKVYPAYFIEASKFGDRATMQMRKGRKKTSDYTSSRDDLFTYVWGKELDVDIAKPVDSIGFTDRYESREFKLLVDFALGELAKDFPEAKESMLEVAVVTGVPTADYMQDRLLEQISKTIKGDHSVTIDGVPLNVRVRSVSLLPQPMGTIVGAMVDDEGELIEDNPIENAVVGIADIGGGTLLVDMLRKMNMDMDKRLQSASGAYTLYESIVRELAKNGRVITVYEVEQVLRNAKSDSYYWSPDGKETLDISQIVMKERILFTREIASMIKSVFKEFDRISAVLVTGGAANLLVKSEFSASVPKSLYIDDSEKANVNGFYKYGLWQGLVK